MQHISSVDRISTFHKKISFECYDFVHKLHLDPGKIVSVNLSAMRIKLLPFIYTLVSVTGTGPPFTRVKMREDGERPDRP